MNNYKAGIYRDVMSWNLTEYFIYYKFMSFRIKFNVLLYLLLLIY